jgi:hypothetical protein
MTSALEPISNATLLQRRSRIGDTLTRVDDDRMRRQSSAHAMTDAGPHEATFKEWRTSRGSHPRPSRRTNGASAVSAAKSP